MLIHINATEQFKNNKKGIAILNKLIDKAYHMDTNKCSNTDTMKSVIFIPDFKEFDIKHFLANNKVLVLSVTKQWFDLMETGEKTSEFRKPTKFIKDRLFNKDGSAKQYDYILINNGYGYHLPLFIAKYDGFGTGYNNQYTFSDGSTLNVSHEDYNIFLGKIIYKANIKLGNGK